MWHPLCPVNHTSCYQNSLYIHPIYVIILIDNTVPFYLYWSCIHSLSIYHWWWGADKGSSGVSWRNIMETIDHDNVPSPAVETKFSGLSSDELYLEVFLVNEVCCWSHAIILQKLANFLFIWVDLILLQQFSDSSNLENCFLSQQV